MSGPGTTVLETILGLPSAASFLYVLFKLAQDEGAGHPIPAFLFPFFRGGRTPAGWRCWTS